MPPLGIGTWQWGDRLMWGYGKGDYTDADLRAAFEAAVASGAVFFDTAEVYGLGRSERLLGRFIGETEAEVIVATKFMPFPWRLTRQQLLWALHRSLRRLGLDHVDLYQIHWPPLAGSIAHWAEALADVVEAGLARHVGVSNFSVMQMEEAFETLARRGIILASNQVEYNLLHRTPEKNGLLQTCKDLGVTLIAYSPLRKGILTGKYTPDNLPSGARRRLFDAAYLVRIKPLIDLLKEMGRNHDGKTPTQVALNWTICKGAVPIPGVKTPKHVASNLGALGWRLTEDEIAQLDQVSAEVAV
ncbi:MAG: aldo/keto reductase [Anaerolineae bacterium]|nr:aldo/keto reductase [Anaerolineae bacterium]